MGSSISNGATRAFHGCCQRVPRSARPRDPGTFTSASVSPRCLVPHLFAPAAVKAGEKKQFHGAVPKASICRLTPLEC